MENRSPQLAPPAPCLVVDLAAYRAASGDERNAMAKPLFKPSAWPDMDFRSIGQLLDDAAGMVRKSFYANPDAVAAALNSLAANSRKAAENIAEMEKRVRKDTKARMEKKLRKAKKKAKRRA